MKDIFTKIIFTLSMLCLDVPAMSQLKKIKIGITGMVAVPGPLLNYNHKAGFGGSIYGKYQIDKNHWNIGLTIGWIYLKGDPIDYSLTGNPYFTVVSKTIIPITSTIEYYILTDHIKPYIGLDAGIYHVIDRNNYFAASTSQTSTTLYPGAAPVVGVEIKIKEHIDMNVNVKYHTYINPYKNATYGSQLPFMGFNLGASYVF